MSVAFPTRRSAQMPSNEQWSDLEPLIEACRAHPKVPSPPIGQTLKASLWHHQPERFRWLIIGFALPARRKTDRCQIV
ncbi:hypothetical protein ACLNGM_09725 [Aureimonas phyllosphaerae]|uniref:hypothetical protein n=1 Tax=Aureimonas phyllosphaerae TaxID=1166078 RepID=UPI003A5C53D4